MTFVVFSFPQLHGKLCCHSLEQESFLLVESSCRSSFSLEKWGNLCNQSFFKNIEDSTTLILPNPNDREKGGPLMF